METTTLEDSVAELRDLDVKLDTIIEEMPSLSEKEQAAFDAKPWTETELDGTRLPYLQIRSLSADVKETLERGNITQDEMDYLGGLSSHACDTMDVFTMHINQKNPDTTSPHDFLDKYNKEPIGPFSEDTLKGLAGGESVRAASIDGPVERVRVENVRTDVAYISPLYITTPNPKKDIKMAPELFDEYKTRSFEQVLRDGAKNKNAKHPDRLTYEFMKFYHEASKSFPDRFQDTPAMSASQKTHQGAAR